MPRFLEASIWSNCYWNFIPQLEWMHVMAPIIDVLRLIEWSFFFIGIMTEGKENMFGLTILETKFEITKI